jgi:hypothetical protein
MNIQQLIGGRSFEVAEDGCIISCNCRGYAMTVKCDKCHRDIDFVLWIIVDVDSRPDLLRQIKSGELHDPKCNCGHNSHLEADLLVFRPSQEPAILFSPANGNTPEETQKVGRSFLLKLKKQMGKGWNPEWYEKDGKRGMYTIVRLALPAFLWGSIQET